MKLFTGKSRKPGKKITGVRRVVTASSPQISPEKSMEKKKKNIKIPKLPWRKINGALGGILFIVLLFGGIFKGYQYLYHGEHFNLKTVKIGPAKHLSRKEILLLGGLDKKINIFSIKPGKVKKRLERHPWIKKASVSRVLPDTVIVEIVEEEAICGILFSDDGDENDFYLASEEGKIFKKADLKTLRGKYIISGFSRKNFSSNPGLVQRRIGNVIKLMKQYESLNSRPAVSEVFVQGDTASLYLRKHGTSIQLDISNYESELLVFDQFLANIEIALKDIRKIYLDNRENPNRVIIIPVKKPMDNQEKNEPEAEKLFAKTKKLQPQMKKQSLVIRKVTAGNKKKFPKNTRRARKNPSQSKTRNKYLTSNR
ncbi:MAG: FtsQ-type POTRA domain-containing protein [Deltaproteobacteria bacterium]|nr:FtsQ-type POTRA domain-containing protein [Deltaproteobacteria bacterium]